MAGATLQKFSLAGLARATQESLDWKSWVQGGRGVDTDGPPSREVLEKLIEGEIIPRLMLTTQMPMHADVPRDELEAPSDAFAAHSVEAFARRAIEEDPGALVSHVHALMDAGASHEDVLLKLLTPAARRLGKMWEDDSADFADVTIGLMKLHRVLERIRSEAPAGLGEGGASPRILLTAAPGEQHLFGIVMVGEFFSRSGWRVCCDVSPEDAQLVNTVACDDYDVVGISASGSVDVKGLKALIRDVRAASCNQDLVILAGGQAFNEDVDLAKRIGADATAADGVRAVVTAERMVHRLARAGRALQA